MKNFLNIFKKVFVFLLIIPAMFVFSACGKKKNKTPDEKPPVIEEPIGGTEKPDDGKTDDAGGQTPEPVVEKYSVQIDYALPSYFEGLLENETVQVNVGDNYELPQMTGTDFEGYLEGWYLDSDDSKIEELTISANKDETVSIYAKWNTLEMERYFCTSGVEFEFDDNDDSAKVINYDKGTSSIVIIPKGIKNGQKTYYVDSFGADCFKNNKVVTEIRANLEDYISIESGAFENSKLQKFDFSNVKSIGDSVFKNTKIEGDIEFSNALSAIGISAFEGCDLIENVDFSKVSNDSIEKIPNNLFANCTNLKTIKLANSMNEIGVKAFSNCSEIELFDFETSNITIIGDYAFENCISLDNIVIPSTIVSYGTKIFEGCTSVKSMTLYSLFYNEHRDPNRFDVWYGDLSSSLENLILTGDVVTIKRDYFKNFFSLKTIDMSSVTKIEKGAFDGCVKLENITFSTSADFNADNINIETLKNTKWYSNLELNVQDYTVINQTLVYLKSSLEGSFDIPENVEYVCKNVFANTNITSVKISSAVKTLNNNAFTGSKVNAISVDENNHNFVVESGRISYDEENENESIVVNYYALYETRFVENGDNDEYLPDKLILYMADKNGGLFKVSESASVVYDSAFSTGVVPEYIYVSSDEARVVFNGYSSRSYIFENSNITTEGDNGMLEIYRYISQIGSQGNYYEINVDEETGSLYPDEIDYSKLPNFYCFIVIVDDTFGDVYYLVDKRAQTVDDVTHMITEE